MAQELVETGHVAVMVIFFPYVAGLGDMVRDADAVCTAPKLTLGITPLGG